MPFKGLERSWISQTRRQRDSRNDQSNRLRLFLSDAHCKYSANQGIVLIRDSRRTKMELLEFEEKRIDRPIIAKIVSPFLTQEKGHLFLSNTTRLDAIIISNSLDFRFSFD